MKLKSKVMKTVNFLLGKVLQLVEFTPALIIKKDKP